MRPGDPLDSALKRFQGDAGVVGDHDGGLNLFQKTNGRLKLVIHYNRGNPRNDAGVFAKNANQIVELLGTRGGNWEILATAAFVSISVPLVVFFAMQRYLVRGLLAGSVK